VIEPRQLCSYSGPSLGSLRHHMQRQHACSEKLDRGGCDSENVDGMWWCHLCSLWTEERYEAEHGSNRLHLSNLEAANEAQISSSSPTTTSDGVLIVHLFVRSLSGGCGASAAAITAGASSPPTNPRLLPAPAVALIHFKVVVAAAAAVCGENRGGGHRNRQ
jgi:hypothetical protein